MPSGGEIAGGLVLCVVAGILNGSWNASFKPELNLAVSPESRRSVLDHNNMEQNTPTTPVGSAEEVESDKQSEKQDQPPKDLDHHLSFSLFMLYAAVINIPICLFWAGGPDRVSFVIREAEASSFWAVVSFSLVWGVGSVFLGLACKIAGVGLGTNLSMGIILTLGAFLPMLVDQVVATAAGGIIIAGIALCLLGLWLASKSLALRDAEQKDHIKGLERELSNIPIDTEGQTEEEILRNSAKRESIRASMMTVPESSYSTAQKIAVCIVSGVTSSMLQFAFVFGDDLIDIAEGEEGPGSTPKSGAAAVIWLLAISIGSIVGIINAIFSSAYPLWTVFRAPLTRHAKIIVTTSLPWLAHIHLYGLCANVLLPSDVAASIAWPILMAVTTLQGMVLSVLFKEWEIASAKTIRTLRLSLGAMAVGVGIIMTSLAA